MTELRVRARICRLMCAKAVRWGCHRRTVADALAVRDFPVAHVLSGTRHRPHELTPFAEVVYGGGVRRPVYPAEEPGLWGDKERS